MQKTAIIILAALALGACGEDAVAPSQALVGLDDVAEIAFAGSFVGDPGDRLLPLVHRLPDDLKLTSEQETQIRALIATFVESTRADHQALAAIMQEARAAARAGASREEIRAILQQGLPIRERLHAAETQLRADILAVLTAEQKAWLAANQPGACTASPLSEAQKTEIAALVAAFEQANLADIQAIRAAFEQARAARRNGASAEEVRAILAPVAPAVLRVRAAEIELAAAIASLLTPEQLACHRWRWPLHRWQMPRRH
jgi:Spy/CpxP family protein refolding chaperone